MSLNSDPKETCAKTWNIAAAQATHKNNYYNLQIDSFINHAILNKTTIKSTLGLQTVYLKTYGIPGIRISIGWKDYRGYWKTKYYRYLVRYKLCETDTYQTK